MRPVSADRAWRGCNLQSRDQLRSNHTLNLLKWFWTAMQTDFRYPQIITNYETWSKHTFWILLVINQTFWKILHLVRWFSHEDLHFLGDFPSQPPERISRRRSVGAAGGWTCAQQFILFHRGNPLGAKPRQAAPRPVCLGDGLSWYD